MITAPKMMPVPYRITYEVQRWSGWEHKRIVTYDRSEATEQHALLDSIQHSPDVQPPLRNVKKHW